MVYYMKYLLISVIACVLSNITILAQESPEEVEAWAKENFEYYSQAPRSEIVMLRADKARAIYSLFSPEQKAEVWKYKWKDIKKSKRLSKAEKKELNRIYSLVSPKIFDTGTHPDLEWEKVVKEVEQNLTEKYGWSEANVYFYLMDPLTEKELEDYCNIYKEYNLDFSTYIEISRN